MKTIFSFPSLDDDAFPASSLWNSLAVMSSRFPTEAAAEAHTPLAAIDYVDVIDEATAGDEAAGVFHKTDNDGADVPAHDHYITVAGKNFAYLSRTIKLNTIGKAEPFREVQARLEELNDKGGGELKIRDTHLIAGAIDPVLTADMVLDFGMSGAFNTPGPGANPNVFNLRDDTPGVTLCIHDLVFINPRIDVSAGTGGAGNTGTGILTTGFKKLEIHGGRFFAGTGGLTLDHGDSAIAVIGAQEVLIDGISATGFDDCGIYMTGGSDVGSPADNGWSARIVNSFFEYCSNAIASKRSYHHVSVLNNTMRFSRIGVLSAGADTLAQPGLRMDVIGNLIEKSQRYGINLAGPTKAIIANNRIKDWGYTPDGGTVSGIEEGIFLDGISEALIDGNILEMFDWTPVATTTGLRVQDNPDIMGTAYNAGKITSRGNRFKNLGVGIDDTAAQDASIFSNEHFDNVTTKFNIDAASLITYTEQGSGKFRSTGNAATEFNNGVASFSATLTDDTATSFQFPISPNTYLITVGCDDTGAAKPNGLIWGRRSTPILANLSLTPFTNIGLYAVAMTGTTGTDVQTNLSMAAGGIFYIENRSGATRKYSVLVQPIG